MTGRRPLLPTLAVVGAALAATPAVAAPVYTVTGRGYGHGIGLSQYGAQGLARQGADHRAILARYYPGTRVSPAPVARIRVLLRDAARFTLDVPPRSVLRTGARRAVPVRGRLVVRRAGARVVVLRNGRVLLRGPAVRVVARRPVALDGARHRGILRLMPADGVVRAVADLPLDAYVRGVVAGEMPASWEAEALRAQAVVARTYALAVRRPSGSFDVYPDTRSQVYGGVAAETPSTDAAVRATAGAVVTYRGRIATTYFYSSSGGRTAAIEDVWGGEPVPYLVSRPDPTDRISPYSAWTPVRYTARNLGAMLGTGPVTDVRIVLNKSSRVERMTVTVAGGATRTLVREEARWALGLRSSFFRIRAVDLRSVRRLDAARVRATAVVRPGGLVRLIGAGPDGRLREVARTTAPAGRVTLEGAAPGLRDFQVRVGPAVSARLGAGAR